MRCGRLYRIHTRLYSYSKRTAPITGETIDSISIEFKIGLCCALVYQTELGSCCAHNHNFGKNNIGWNCRLYSKLYARVFLAFTRSGNDKIILATSNTSLCCQFVNCQLLFAEKSLTKCHSVNNSAAVKLSVVLFVSKYNGFILYKQHVQLALHKIGHKLPYIGITQHCMACRFTVGKRLNVENHVD